MAHNPFNDLYVDSLDDVMRDARRSWEIAAAICHREIRHYQPKVPQSSSEVNPKERGNKPNTLSSFSYDADFDGDEL